MPYIYLEKQLGDFILEDINGNKLYAEKIIRFCGDLGNLNLLYTSFSEEKLRKKKYNKFA